MDKILLSDEGKQLSSTTVIANLLVPHYTAIAGDKYEKIAILASCQLIADEIIAKAAPLIRQETAKAIFDKLEDYRVQTRVNSTYGEPYYYHYDLMDWQLESLKKQLQGK